MKGADLYEKTVARTRAAMAFGALEGMLLHRGESDSNRPQDAETYEAGLVQMFEDFRQDVGSPDLPIIVGQLGTFVHASRVKVVMAAIRRLPDDLAAVGAAHSARLEHKGDHVHCDAASQHEFGRRYADAMLKLKEAGAPPGSAPCEDTFGMWPILAFHRSTIPRNPPR